MFISKDIFFRVASFVKKSFRIDIVDMLSDWKVALPLLKNHLRKRNHLQFKLSKSLNVVYLKLELSCWNYNTCIQLEELSQENLRRTKSLLRHLRRAVFLELQGGKILAKCAFQLVRMVLLTATCYKVYDGFDKMNIT